MGQARNRGTREERVAQAIVARRAADEERARKREAERLTALQRAEEERAKRRERAAVLVSHADTGRYHHGKHALMVALAALSAAPAFIAPLPRHRDDDDELNKLREAMNHGR